MAVSDEGSYKLSDSCKNEIKKFGSTLIDKLDMRLPWAFIGRKSSGK